MKLERGTMNAQNAKGPKSMRSPLNKHSSHAGRHTDRQTYTHMHARIKSITEGNMMRTLQNFRGIQRPEIQYTNRIKTLERKKCRDDPLIIMLLHRIQCICLFSFLSMHDNLLSDKNKFSKINLTIKANQFYCVCVCLISISQNFLSLLFDFR